MTRKTSSISAPSFQNLSSALGKIRGARPDDVIVNAPSPSDVPKSDRYVAKSMSARDANRVRIRRDQTLYGRNRKAPHATSIIVKDPGEERDMLIGELDAISDRFSSQRGYVFSIEALIALTLRKRIRRWALTLFPPQELALDPQAFGDQRHMNIHLNERDRYLAHRIFRCNGPFEEFDMEELRESVSQLHYGQTLAADEEATLQDSSLSIEGFESLIKTICDGHYVDATNPGMSIYERFGVPGKSTLIRLSLDAYYGIVLTRAHLDTASGQAIFRAWLRDILFYTTGEWRRRMFDPTLHAYRLVHENDPAPPAQGFHHLHNALSRELNNREG